MEWVKFVIVAVCLILGGLIEISAVFGVFKFKYVLNRMHASAMGDTLGLLLIAIGMCIVWGFSLTTLKIVGMIVFFMLTSPVACHLLGKMETKTNDELDKECEVMKE